MSLLFIDSFKNYSFLPMKWDERTALCRFYIKPSIGRRGGQALAASRQYKENDSDFIGKNLNGNFETIIIGFAFKRLTYSGDFFEVHFCDGNATQTCVIFYSTSIGFYTTSFSNNFGKYFLFELNTWYYIEIKVKAHDTLGTLTIKVDENVILNLSNINTVSTSNFYFNKVRLGGRYASENSEDFMYIEDLYIINNLGSTNNDFLGNCEISVVSPISQGEFSDFLPSPSYSGSPNYTLVNDLVYQQDLTSYNSTYYEYDSLDDGCYIQNPNNTTWIFNNTSTLVPSNPIYMHTNNGRTNSYYWFRFSNINIPKNSKILQANLVVNLSTAPASPDLNIQYIRLQKIGTPAPQILNSSDLYSRVFTYNYTSATYGENISNKNIANSLQELVDLPDWQTDNNSVLVVINVKYLNHSTGLNTLYYTSYDANNNSLHTSSPKFFVQWQTPDGSSGKYIKSSNIGASDTYFMATTSGFSNILAVNYCIAARREFDLDNDNNAFLQATTVSSGISYFGGSFLPSNLKYTFSTIILDKNPCTNLPWVSDSLLNNSFGFVTVSG